MRSILRDIDLDIEIINSEICHNIECLKEEIAYESAIDGSYDIAIEANILQKIKSAITKMKSDKKKGKEELDAAIDELSVEEQHAKQSGDEDKQKKLSTVAKIGIGLISTALLGTAAYMVRKGSAAKGDSIRSNVTKMRGTSNPSSIDLRSGANMLNNTSVSKSNLDTVLQPIKSTIMRCNKLKARYDDMQRRKEEAEKNGNRDAVRSISTELTNIAHIYNNSFATKILPILKRLDPADKSTAMQKLALPEKLK